MFLTLAHQQLQAFTVSKDLVKSCYQFTATFPSTEKYGLTSQIRRAAVSVHLNIAEGSSRRSAAERKRFFEIARSSLAEIDASLDLARSLEFPENEHLPQLGDRLIQCFRLLTGLIR